MRFDPQSITMHGGVAGAENGYADISHEPPRGRISPFALIFAVGVSAALGGWMWRQGALEPLVQTVGAMTGPSEAMAAAHDPGETPSDAAVGLVLMEATATTSTASATAEVTPDHPGATQATMNGRSDAGKGRLSRTAYAQGRRNMAVRRYRQAIPYLKQAVKLDPGFADAQYQLGLAYTQTGEFDSARETQRRLSRLDSNLASLLGSLIR